MPATLSQALAERHEALWLKLSALHKDVSALAARRPSAPVSEPIRITAEALLSDCAPFGGGNRLPVAAPELGGLLVQLGQALAWLEHFETRFTLWDPAQKCRCWRLERSRLPVMRLHPQPVGAEIGTKVTDEMRQRVFKRMEQLYGGQYEQGFAAGRAARQGRPAAEPGSAPLAGETYPRLRRVE